MKRMATFGVIILSSDNKNVLVVFQNYSQKWSLPKGQDDKEHESNFNCALRELEEETGIQRGEYKIIGEITYYTHVFYIARLKPDFNRQMKTNDPIEISIIRWIPFNATDLKLFIKMNDCNTTIRGLKENLNYITYLLKINPIKVYNERNMKVYSYKNTNVRSNVLVWKKS